jgi:ATP-dependent helicase/nuclease subunit A
MNLKEQLIKENYNSEQIEVILDQHKETIVPAGAGSGKTKTLVKKVITLLENKVPLDQLLVLTFTNKASFEMKDRIKKALASNPSLNHLVNKIDTSSIQTFDAFALNYVKQNASFIGKESNLEILDATVLKTAKYEKMSRLIYRYYLDDQYIVFFRVFTNKTIFRDLTDMLIKLYDSISSKVQIEDIAKLKLDKYLIKHAHMLLDQVELINDAFYENNSDILVELRSFLQSLFDGTWNPEQKQNIRFKWDDAKHVKNQIKALIDPIVNLYKQGIEQRHLDDYKNLYHQYETIIKEIMVEFHQEIETFKEETNKYDFSDISKFLIDILLNNHNLLNRMRNQYRYIFVDEFQDTSDVQYQFLDMMIKDNDQVQVLYVGDIKQSIYKFRDAKPELFIKKQVTANQIRLKTNYRSSKPIIDIVNRVFTHILDDESKLDINYQDGHVMASGSTFYHKDSFANVYIEEMFNEDPSKSKYNVLEEAFTIGKKIKELISAHSDINYKDMTILLRNTTAFDQYREVFEYLNIPLQIQTDVKINQGYFLKLLTNILMLALYFENHEKEFVKQNRFNYLSLGRSELLNLDDGVLFNQLKNKKENPDIDIEILNKLKTLKSIIKEGTNFEIIQKLLEIFDVESKIIHSYEHYKKEIEIDYLYKLAESLKDLGYQGERFVVYLHNMMYQKEEQIKLSILQDHEEDSVKITNIHQSKGLEYKILFLGGLDKPIRKSIDITAISYDTEAGLIIKKLKQDEHKPLELLLKLNKTIAKELIYQSSIKEELRLLYVAMTRAERALYLVLLHKENRDDMRTFGDFLVDADVYDMIDGSRITKYDESQFESHYYQGLSMKNMYYPSNIDQLKPKLYKIESLSVENKRASIKSKSLLISDVKEKMKQGTKLHEIFEYSDYKTLRSSDNPMLKSLGETRFSNHFIEEAQDVIHEYEFYDEKNNVNGIIDLLVVYDDEIHIIDYKTMDIDADKYGKQLNRYKEYIKMIYPKYEIKVFLYSIKNNKVNII